MIYPKGENPESILNDYPTEIAFAAGASSGESGTKAAFVKNWWWEGNKVKFLLFQA